MSGAVRTRYLQAGATAFALSACADSLQKRKIGHLHQQFSEADETIRQGFGAAALASLKVENDRQFLTVQIVQCAGEEGILRHQAALQDLRKVIAEAGKT